MNAKESLSASSTSFPPPLFKHQQQTLAKLAKTRLLFDQSDPGTGKTRPEIEDIARRRAKNGGRAIITATKSIIEAAWGDDFAKFAPDLKVGFAYANNREKVFNDHSFDVIVTNHDAVNWLVKQRKPFFKTYDTLIHDESTAFKNHTSKRSKAAAKISDYFEYRRLMTGTPMSNGICDIWHQVYLLDGGERLGDEFKAFQKAACRYVPNEGDSRFGDWVDRDDIEVIIGKLIEDISIRHVFEECVDIPPNLLRPVKYKMPRKHRQAYQTMFDDKLLEIKDKVITAVNGGSFYQKTLQISSGAVYDGNGAYGLIDTGRYELVLDLVEEREHSVVFFFWDHQLQQLIQEAEARGISFAVIDGKTKDVERTQITKDYQNGRYRTIFAHPKSAGHGLTLTKGTRTIFASPTDNLEYFLQGYKRIYRIGQTEKTETIVVIAEDTIDERVYYEILSNKNARQSDYLKLIRELTKQV